MAAGVPTDRDRVARTLVERLEKAARDLDAKVWTDKPYGYVMSIANARDLYQDAAKFIREQT